MRADRLISILLLLQRNHGMKTRELAEQLEVSERTVLRDMEALSGAGIPIYAQRGSQGGWFLAEGYRTTLNGLSREELQALLLVSSSRVVSDLGKSRAYERALMKLLSAMPASYRQEAGNVRMRLHVDGAGWHKRDEPLPYLNIVQEAVWAERRLLIEYPHAGEQGAALRLVEPLGLVVKGTVWYVVAAVEGDLRTYRISRIISARMTDETFTRPASFDLAEYWEQSMRAFKASLPEYPVILRADPAALSRLTGERYVHVRSMKPEPGGSWTVVEADFETADSACRVILGCGPGAVVLEPAELRARLLAAAREIAARYEGD